MQKDVEKRRNRSKNYDEYKSLKDEKMDPF
jgi:hypothetical protein